MWLYCGGSQSKDTTVVLDLRLIFELRLFELVGPLSVGSSEKMFGQMIFFNCNRYSLIMVRLARIFSLKSDILALFSSLFLISRFS